MIQEIKTLKRVNRENESLNFGISRMEEIYERRGGVKDDPHRHDFYTVLLVVKGKGEHIIDFNSYPIEDMQVHFIGPGQVHQVIEHEASTGYSMVFSTRFLLENHIPVDFIEDLNLFNNYGYAPPMSLEDSQLGQLRQICEEMLSWYKNPRKHWSHAIGSLLKLFLIECNNHCSLPSTGESPKEGSQRILKDFRRLVNENYREMHSTSAYADRLHITPDHLNRVIKTQIGKTAKEYIQARIMIAARRMLYFTQLSNKEIAYALGFSEPAHFSSFFKKCSGTSPSAFRKEH